jgi:hypothetical protein
LACKRKRCEGVTEALRELYVRQRHASGRVDQC